MGRMIEIDDEIHEKMKKCVEENKFEYPSMRNFVHRAILDKIKQKKGEQCSGQ
jgi:hypothetical protein